MEFEYTDSEKITWKVVVNPPPEDKREVTAFAVPISRIHPKGMVIPPPIHVSLLDHWFTMKFDEAEAKQRMIDRIEKFEAARKGKTGYVKVSKEIPKCK